MTTIKLKTLIIIIAYMTFFAANTYSQENKNNVTEKKETKQFQFTFIYPMGTNGANSQNITNDISLNILGGYNGNAINLSYFFIYDM